jgi:hypothetical protein
MTGAPWEFGCAPRELHEMEMDIFGAPPQQWEFKRARCGKGKQLATSTLITRRSGMMR